MADNFRSNKDEVFHRLKAGYERNVLAAILLWHGAIGRRMQRGPTRTGRVYKVPGTSVEYVASAEGESPAVRTGLLVQSYDTDLGPTVGRVGTPEKYGLHLERGTENIAPRPVIREAFNDARDAIEQELRREIE
ncbi:hypothetical protein [Roseinatronobacter alkalisoli]|uniref:HK97 gp10 family phage protein n=1 Tax=Roseinatronobacter alkalisoli TaxID=3028235 RepID=A0ABT5TH03_9RHOB|nr:hypothetical protein [Roseinatronobacter sp. HJB301]MDD7973442.1 hypothetical protein [Roseinatronobacter sp. HJB301]